MMAFVCHKGDNHTDPSKIFLPPHQNKILKNHANDEIGFNQPGKKASIILGQGASIKSVFDKGRL